MSIRNDLLERILNALTQGGTTVDTAYCDYALTAPQALTSTLTKVTGYTQKITPQNITESGGTFTSSFDGIAKLTLERFYTNRVASPATVVTVTIELRKNGLPILSRTATIGNQTSQGGPGTLPVTTPFLLPITSGDTFEIYVSAEDGGATPSDTELTNLEFVVDNLHNKPV